MTEHSGSMLQLQMYLTGRPLTSSYSISMPLEPRLVDPMSLPLTHQNQLEPVLLRFCASHGPEVVEWPLMPHVIMPTAVPAALALIMPPLAIPVPFLQQVSANMNSPFLSLMFAVCCYLVLSIFHDIAGINSSFMICYCMILFVFLS